ncbi:MAG: serine protease, partial [Winogradskyella sp.]|nr:serine protease [Winogradskyella sp.]
MKKILTLVGVSVLGGLVTLGGYKLFIEKEQPEQLAVEQVSDLPIYVPTNTTVNSTAAMTPNFVDA